MKETGGLPPGVSVDISGASDQLDATRASLGSNLWVAVALCYLQLVIIYRHWGDPFLILATVPLGWGECSARVGPQSFQKGKPFPPVSAIL